MATDENTPSNQDNPTNQQGDPSQNSPTGYMTEPQGGQGKEGGEDSQKGASGNVSNLDEQRKKGEESEPSNTSGYGQEPQVTKTEPKPDDSGDDGDDYGILDTEGLSSEQVKDIRAFAKKHRVSKEVAKELIEREKQKVKQEEKQKEQQQEQRELEAQKVRKQWFDELKNDQNFGGENFQGNVKKVDKVLDEFMPNIKKQLTENGGMLPPYVMKDLANLGDKLFSQESFVKGSPKSAETPKDNDEGNDPLAFYG